MGPLLARGCAPCSIAPALPKEAPISAYLQLHNRQAPAGGCPHPDPAAWGLPVANGADAVIEAIELNTLNDETAPKAC